MIFRFFSFFLLSRADPTKTPTQLERDAGFCSGGSEIGDDYQSERQQNSPSNTDISDDSVDIKLSSIVLPTNNKRKSLSTQKSETDIPLKKRIRYEAVFGVTNDASESIPCEQFGNQTGAYRPWQPTKPVHANGMPVVPNEAELFARHPAVTTMHCAPVDAMATGSQSQADDDEQPLALVTRKPHDDMKSNAILKVPRKRSPPKSHKIANDASTATATAIATLERESAFESNDLKLAQPPSAAPRTTEAEAPLTTESTSKKATKLSLQRNYKNMTRERRIEANARERTRVHTISAAFDTLRQAVPSYSSTQKLSKLSVLRVACSYILTLSRMAGDDYSADQSQPSMASCIEEITKTIQTEGKSRKRKDD